jgi:hypothetical protein
MTDPPPITACLSQAGPFRTSARLEIRTDGYFMEDIRELARSGRGTAAQFTHPRLVSLGEFTSTQARAEAARAQTQWTHREPAAIQQTMPMNDNFQPTNAWSQRTTKSAPGTPDLPLLATTVQARCPHHPPHLTTYAHLHSKQGLRSRNKPHAPAAPRIGPPPKDNTYHHLQRPLNRRASARRTGSTSHAHHTIQTHQQANPNSLTT